MKKGTKIAIISSSAFVGVVAIVLVLLFAVLPAIGINLFAKGQEGEVKDSVDFTQKVADYAKAPSASTSQSDIMKALVYNESTMSTLYSSTKDKNLIAAQMMFASYVNLANAHQYSYFSNKIGTTDLGDKSGTLVVQRMRRQTKEIKDDTTFKLPINHNFGGVEVFAVSGENKTAIRYVKNGKLYKITSVKLAYDEKTGFISCTKWKKDSKKFGTAEKVSDSANVTETRINYLSLVEGMVYEGATTDMKFDKPKAIFKKDTAKIEDKGEYYEIYVEVDSDVADNDSATKTFFDKDNGATGVHISKCIITFQLWKCGLPKAYTVDETWSGKISGFSGEANAKTDCKYSYSDKDCTDDSITLAIKDSVA